MNSNHLFKEHSSHFLDSEGPILLEGLYSSQNLRFTMHCRTRFLNPFINPTLSSSLSEILPNHQLKTTESMANSIFKSHVFRKNSREMCLWPKTILPNNATLSSCRRFSNLPFLLPNHIRLRSSSLPICRSLLVHLVPCVPLHRRRLSPDFVSMSSITPSQDIGANPPKTVR
ncbi:unnamed protein product [Fraxinus pennsylvanica]|uniref:Uncharacterized protein n=1 Tax=Fraxinus pennsylvanica TaxID=56036 RepID=A0AAD2A813_9LAMI|nr:unnamed protein product [Fraxinus pennsylvanica]